VEILLRASKQARTAQTIGERESFYSIFSPEIEWIAGTRHIRAGRARWMQSWASSRLREVELWLVRRGRAEAGVRLAATLDQNLLAGGGALLYQPK
jgi:hypothetical protein